MCAQKMEHAFLLVNISIFYLTKKGCGNLYVDYGEECDGGTGCTSCNCSTGYSAGKTHYDLGCEASALLILLLFTN